MENAKTTQIQITRGELSKFVSFWWGNLFKFVTF